MLRTRLFTQPAKPERKPKAWPGPQAFASANRCDGVEVAQPKTEIIRSEAYRRLVAAMPCIACGCGPCQAAHPNTGKGMAMKTDDRLCFPLCGPQRGRPGCHALFDQGAMFSKAARRVIEPAWGADTRRRILANGQWPKRLPVFEEERPANQSARAQPAINSGAI
nr:MAG TPA: Protein of unknown function (DUF1364) [Caudoviricetes sp.]